ncbi:MAG: LptE family protein [Candidatus Firestonebacteria bacterium]
MLKKIFLVTFIFLSLLAGCGYTGKSILPPTIKKVAIPTFANKTLKYGIETRLTQSAIREFLIDGRLEIVSPEKADAIIEGTIRKYFLEPLLYDANNVVIQYRLKMVVDILFKDVKSNKIIWEQSEIGGIPGGSTTFYVSSSGVNGVNRVKIDTEQEALERVYEKIARDIVNRVIYGWENP